MAKWRDKLLNSSLEMGMSVVQKALGHPTVGPLLMRSISQGMQMKAQLEQSREQLLAKMQLASFQEQEELRTHVNTLEKKIERLERRLRDMHAQARAAKKEAEAAKRAQEPPTPEAPSDPKDEP